MEIKQAPEDFVVKERSTLRFDEAGDYLYLKLTKKGITTLDAIKLIADRLRIPEQHITCAGIKDKQAVTEQAISIQDKNRSIQQRIGQLALPDIRLEIVGRGIERIMLGDLEGNEFTIIVRDLDGREIQQARSIDGKTIHVENYFDEQRFQIKNVPVGLHLLRREYADACALLGLATDNALNTLNKLPKRELLFALSAVQSYLFNEILAAKVKHQDPAAKEVGYSQGAFAFSDKELTLPDLPLMGFATEFAAADEPLFRSVLDRLGITERDFVLRQLNGMAQEGSVRHAMVTTTLASTVHGDNAALSFFLPKASYATIVIKKVFA